MAKASRGCKCKHSKCVKLYCECFQGGRVCEGKCICVECKNTLAESREGGVRYLRIQELLAKRSNAFDVREKKTTDEGCRCKKSNCLKKYCVCFREGKKCEGNTCRCNDCKNTDLQGEDSDGSEMVIEEESGEEELSDDSDAEGTEIEYNAVCIAYPSAPQYDKLAPVHV